MQIYNRADIVAFMKINDTYTRMQGFTDLSKSANASTYSRRYVDEAFEREDVTGYSQEIAYGFDRIVDNEVHKLMAEIHDKEQIGVSVEILSVDMNSKTGSNYEAKVRTYSVIPDTEGDGTDAYTYTGRFKKASEYIIGTATVSADGLTATFTSPEL